MGAFKSFIENVAKQKSVVAVDNVIKEIEDTIDTYMGDYYADYYPKWYKRTGTMKSSVMSFPAIQDGIGASGEVYIMNSKYEDGTWDVYDAVDAADMLTHGGYDAGGGVSVWETPIDGMKKDESGIWMDALSKAGFDIQ